MSGPDKQFPVNQALKIDLKIDSDTANLRLIRRQAEDFAAQAGFDRQACDAVGLALNEALANVIRHGYGGAKDQPILVSLERGGGELRVSIRDWAPLFDPAKLPNPDRAAAAGELKPGGLGLLCIKRMMDQVTYEPQNDGMLLKMVKRIPTKA